MSVTTCKKIYADIPWAHRQHRHDGHCALLHGHNWSIGVTFSCSRLDDNGFVIDFGKVKFLKKWIDDHLDHACVFNREDPMREALLAVGESKVWKAYTVECCSCEGMAKHIFEVFNGLVQNETAGRARVVSIEVIEDSKNSALYSE